MTISSLKALFEKIFSMQNIEMKYNKSFHQKRAVGIDGITKDLFSQRKDKEFETIHKKCLNGTYRFTPYLEVLVLKGRNKFPRMIAVPTLRDQLVLSLLKDFLHHKKCFNDCLQNKLPNQIIEEINKFSVSVADYSFLKTDISGFYDNIEREILMNALRKRIQDKEILTLIFKAIVNPIVPKDYQKKLTNSYLTAKGVPQGLAISNILSDIYMCEFDGKISSMADCYVRYVDDILVMYDKRKELRVKQRMKSLLTMLSLQMNEGKTITGSKATGYEFLGYVFKGDKITVRKSTLDSFMQSLASMFRNEQLHVESSLKKHEERMITFRGRQHQVPKLTKELYKTIFLEEVNEKLTGALAPGKSAREFKRYGWIFYFSKINDIKVLAHIDAFVRELFNRSDLFEHTVPSQLKSIIMAHRKINYRLKYKYDGYIHDYSAYSTINDKLKYIQFRMQLHEPSYKKERIEELFNELMNKKLKRLHADIGHIS